MCGRGRGVNAADGEHERNPGATAPATSAPESGRAR